MLKAADVVLAGTPFAIVALAASAVPVRASMIEAAATAISSAFRILTSIFPPFSPTFVGPYVIDTKILAGQDESDQYRRITVFT